MEDIRPIFISLFLCKFLTIGTVETVDRVMLMLMASYFFHRLFCDHKTNFQAVQLNSFIDEMMMLSLIISGERCPFRAKLANKLE